jgi:hypothetical protein
LRGAASAGSIPRLNSQAQGRRATVWIVLTAVFALAAIGLGIWAFTTKSDLDDAEARELEKIQDQCQSAVQ